MNWNGMTRRALLSNIATLGVAAGSARTFAATHGATPVQRDFADPYLELIRLLHEAAEIEHDLMVQYLYGAFSLKPAYAELVGGPQPGARSFLGVTIEEMQHLSSVNRLLVELNAAPVLTRQDFPYETDIYPFPFELAPLGQASLAKFTYCEAAPDALTEVRVTGNGSLQLLDQLEISIGGDIAPNHVGYLYDAVIETLGEVKSAGAASIDFDAWFEGLENIKTQGEVGHFEFFESVYTAEHPLLRAMPGVWSLPTNDARHPCYQVPVNPTAYSGHPNCIEDPDLRALAWLGNLNYWCMLSLLDTGYRRNSATEPALAQAIMMGPLMSIAQQLPAKGAAVPFDPLSMGFEPGLTATAEHRFTELMLTETRDFALSIEHLLPASFTPELYDQVLKAL
jgi:rubrerythrin